MASSSKSSKDANFAIIDSDGKEVPVTDDMIEEAILNAKPQSIGKHTIPEMPVITDEMLRKAGKKPPEE